VSISVAKGNAMLSDIELKNCRNLLVSARLGVLWVAQTFYNDANLGAAARLRSIAAQLDVEIEDIDRLLNAPPTKPMTSV
jgi:hypothetical protein